MSKLSDDLRQIRTDLEAEIAQAEATVKTRFQQFVDRIAGLVKKSESNDSGTTPPPGDTTTTVPNPPITGNTPDPTDPSTAS